MGKLRYDSSSPAISIDDAELAHLKIVIGTKLRRGESFMMTWRPLDCEPGALCSAWIHPAIPMEFYFEADATFKIDASHISELIERLNATGDLLLAQLLE